MIFLANENFPKASVIFLRKKGFDILSIGEDSPSISDEEVMKIAIKTQRTILTFDRDYGELIFKHKNKPHEGVIYFRISDFYPEEPAKILIKLLEKKDIQINGYFTVLTREFLRQRKI